MISILYNRKLRLKKWSNIQNQKSSSDNWFYNNTKAITSIYLYLLERKNIYIYVYIGKIYKVILRQYLFPKLFLL